MVIGKRVTIKNDVDSEFAGEWGVIIAKVETDEYHIAMYDDRDTAQVFARHEFTIHKEDK